MLQVVRKPTVVRSADSLTPAMGAVVSAVYGLGGAGVVACMVW